MDFGLADFVIRARGVLATWLTFTVAVAAALAVLLIVAGWWQLWRSSRRARAAGPEPVSVPKPRPAREELSRFAEEVAVAADRAARIADQRRADWLWALRNQQAVWKAYDAAEREAARLDQASAFPVPESGPAPSGYLRKLATEAHERGDLSSAQLAEILEQWPADRHPFELEAELRRVARDGLLRAYQTASALEREAWQALDAATVARRTMNAEAISAVLRARRRPVSRPKTGAAPTVRITSGASPTVRLAPVIPLVPRQRTAEQGTVYVSSRSAA